MVKVAFNLVYLCLCVWKYGFIIIYLIIYFLFFLNILYHFQYIDIHAASYAFLILFLDILLFHHFAQFIIHLLSYMLYHQLLLGLNNFYFIKSFLSTNWNNLLWLLFLFETLEYCLTHNSHDVPSLILDHLRFDNLSSFLFFLYVQLMLYLI